MIQQLNNLESARQFIYKRLPWQMQKDIIEANTTALAFSGGIDSVAVSQFLIQRGVKIPHVAVINHQLDYPEHLRYISEYCRTNGVRLILQIMEDRGMDFVRANPKYILPETSKVMGEWYAKFQQAGLRRVRKSYGFNAMVYGRRLDDGNSIKAEVYKTKDGDIHLFPLIDTSNSQVAQMVSGRKLSLFYGHPTGRKRGTHLVNICRKPGMTLDESKAMVKALDKNMYNKLKSLIRLKWQK